MCTSKTVHVLVEIHHLKTIELVGNSLDLLLFSGLYLFYSWRIPMDVSPRCRHILTIQKFQKLAETFYLGTTIAHTPQLSWCHWAPCHCVCSRFCVGSS